MQFHFYRSTPTFDKKPRLIVEFISLCLSIHLEELIIQEIFFDILGYYGKNICGINIFDQNNSYIELQILVYASPFAEGFRKLADTSIIKCKIIPGNNEPEEIYKAPKAVPNMLVLTMPVIP